MAYNLYLLLALCIFIGCVPPPEVNREIPEVLEPSVKETGAKKQYMYGCEYLKNKMYDDAVKCFKHAIADSSTFVSAYMNLGLAYRGKNEYDKMEQVYKEMIVIAPATGHYALGKLYTDEKRYDQAMIEYKEAVKNDSNYTDAWYGIGYCEEKLGNIKSAIENYEHALTVDDKNESVKYSLSKAYISDGEFEKGIRELKNLRTAHPDDLDVCRTLASTLLDTKNFSEAKLEFEYIAQRLPFDILSRVGLGKSCEGLKDYEGADNAYKEAIAIDTTDISLYYYLITLYTGIKKLNDASKYLRLAKQIAPNNTIIHCLAGDIEAEWGDIEFNNKKFSSAIPKYELAMKEYNSALKGDNKEWATYSQKAIERTRAKLKKTKEEEWWDRH
ncbi:MAG: tetratricopeptide repeat protein [Candidatus Stahlbacteria bacterium]|nr:tetratricopeptide repeat protein [Candidatus Stahlbacteria bacterium]